MSRTLIVLPDEGPAPILALLASAKKSLRVKAFLFDHPALFAALVAARQRGVLVRVLFSRPGHGGAPDNAATRAALQQAGIELADAHHHFAVMHEKSVVVDEHTALVQSLDWSADGFTRSRDYAVVTTHRHEVDEVAACFDADWQHKNFKPGHSPHLIWCPLNGRDRLAALIDSARDRLFIQSECYDGPIIVERLVRASVRGVKIHIMAPAVHQVKQKEFDATVAAMRLLADVGIKVHKLEDLSLHANLLLADEARAVVGSINLTVDSFDNRRELAIEVDDHPIVKALHALSVRDWENSVAFDLSEEGLGRVLAGQDSSQSGGPAAGGQQP